MWEEVKPECYHHSSFFPFLFLFHPLRWSNNVCHCCHSVSSDFLASTLNYPGLSVGAEMAHCSPTKRPFTVSARAPIDSPQRCRSCRSCRIETDTPRNAGKWLWCHNEWMRLHFIAAISVGLLFLRLCVPKLENNNAEYAQKNSRRTPEGGRNHGDVKAVRSLCSLNYFWGDEREGQGGGPKGGSETFQMKTLKRSCWCLWFRYTNEIAYY